MKAKIIFHYVKWKDFLHSKERKFSSRKGKEKTSTHLHLIWRYTTAIKCFRNSLCGNCSHRNKFDRYFEAFDFDLSEFPSDFSISFSSTSNVTQLTINKWWPTSVFIADTDVQVVEVTFRVNARSKSIQNSDDTRVDTATAANWVNFQKLKRSAVDYEVAVHNVFPIKK